MEEQYPVIQESRNHELTISGQLIRGNGELLLVPGRVEPLNVDFNTDRFILVVNIRPPERFFRVLVVKTTIEKTPFRGMQAPAFVPAVYHFIPVCGGRGSRVNRDRDVCGFPGSKWLKDKVAISFF